MKSEAPKKVLVTGGAGYVGSSLVPKLLTAGHNVKVLDLYIYGDSVLNAVKSHPSLQQIKGDIRDRALLQSIINGTDSIIHLACISNDPSFELDPELGKSINYDACMDLLEIAQNCNVRRFVFASSSSVYGVKDEPHVVETLPLEPLTDYSKFKAQCEDEILSRKRESFVPVIFRPATICGYAPRLRLDLAVNIMTNFAVNKRKITVFGGDQMRPNIHIEDMSDLYLKSLEWPDELIDCQIFNVGYENHKVRDLAGIVKSTIGNDVDIETIPTNDKRSYHICSDKIAYSLGFKPKHTIEDAVRGLATAFKDGLITSPLSNPYYYNIKRMQQIILK